MNNIITIAETVFDIVWLTAVLVFLWLIWRNTSKHMRQMEQTLINVAMMDAESARRAVDETRILIETTHNLIAKQKDCLP